VDLALEVLGGGHYFAEGGLEILAAVRELDRLLDVDLPFALQFLLLLDHAIAQFRFAGVLRELLELALPIV
jgi:hypothetical protein